MQGEPGATEIVAPVSPTVAEPALGDEIWILLSSPGPAVYDIVPALTWTVQASASAGPTTIATSTATDTQIADRSGHLLTR